MFPSLYLASEKTQTVLYWDNIGIQHATEEVVGWTVLNDDA